MRRFRCEHCGHEISARATDVAHRCTHNRNRLTPYKEVTDEAQPAHTTE